MAEKAPIENARKLFDQSLTNKKKYRLPIQFLFFRPLLPDYKLILLNETQQGYLKILIKLQSAIWLIDTSLWQKCKNFSLCGKNSSAKHNANNTKNRCVDRITLLLTALTRCYDPKIHCIFFYTYFLNKCKFFIAGVSKWCRYFFALQRLPLLWNPKYMAIHLHRAQLPSTLTIHSKSFAILPIWNLTVPNCSSQI